MARPRAFDEAQALDAAVDTFREHGFEGTSAAMLISAMGIGRQSLYDTFGDKWQLYLRALRHYSATQVEAHLAALRSHPNGLAGIDAFLDRVVAEAEHACLGISSLCEFGARVAQVNAIHQALGGVLHDALLQRVRDAQASADIAADLDPPAVADHLLSSITGIRLAARGGAGKTQLQSLKRMALRALR